MAIDDPYPFGDKAGCALLCSKEDDPVDPEGFGGEDFPTFTERPEEMGASEYQGRTVRRPTPVDHIHKRVSELERKVFVLESFVDDLDSYIEEREKREPGFLKSVVSALRKLRR